MRYYAMAKFDLEMHGGAVGGSSNSGGYDVIQANFDATMLEVGLVHPVDGGHYITSWYHPVQGYDAGYYGYGWSESIAHDFKGEFTGSPGTYFDKPTGDRFAEDILKPGATVDGAAMVHKFLGREASSKPYMEFLGIA